MSTSVFKGSVHSFKVFMRQAQDEIDRGEKTGARVIYRRETHSQVRIVPQWLRKKSA